SCKHESWKSIAKFLINDVPSLLKSEDVKDMCKVLSVIVTSLPSNFEEFIKWVTEIRRQEDNGPSLSEEEKTRAVVKRTHTIFRRWRHRNSASIVLTIYNLGWYHRQEAFEGNSWPGFN
ncbi:glutathione gamma-glutamylcysteinyltransferase 1-like, partial [Trifolium medium]|nr:glutathione gamma-glutamylcysteinyltransferase 1-like [Trifolium medium]